MCISVVEKRRFTLRGCGRLEEPRGVEAMIAFKTWRSPRGKVRVREKEIQVQVAVSSFISESYRSPAHSSLGIPTHPSKNKYTRPTDNRTCATLSGADTTPLPTRIPHHTISHPPISSPTTNRSSLSSPSPCPCPLSPPPPPKRSDAG